MSSTKPLLDALYAGRAKDALPLLQGAAQAGNSPLLSLAFGLADPSCSRATIWLRPRPRCWPTMRRPR